MKRAWATPALPMSLSLSLSLSLFACGGPTTFAPPEPLLPEDGAMPRTGNVRASDGAILDCLGAELGEVGVRIGVGGAHFSSLVAASTIARN